MRCILPTGTALPSQAISSCLLLMKTPELVLPMSQAPVFATVGTEAAKIDVRLSYRIVRLFSEGLYASPNKAIEELVANSFDAGARRVTILLPKDFHEQG